MINPFVHRLRYLATIARNFGWLAVPKFILLSAKRRWKGDDAEIRAKIDRLRGAFFDEIGINIDEASRIARATFASAGIPDDGDMPDLTQVLCFAALQASGFKPKNILQLGTAYGEIARYLATLFPDATVYTLELPESDPLFSSMHPIGEEEYVRRSKQMLSCPNIRAIRANTFDLNSLDLPMFDLVWLDAGHEYPEVAWDHFYCLGRLAAGGWLFSDDIFLPDNFLLRHHQPSLHPAYVIQYINERTGNNFRVLPKRADPSYFSIFEKHIAYTHKTALDDTNDARPRAGGSE